MRKRRRTTTATSSPNNSPFFFAIVTTLRVPEVETEAGDREGAAIVMREPQREDLRADAIVLESFERERAEETKK